MSDSPLLIVIAVLIACLLVFGGHGIYNQGYKDALIENGVIHPDQSRR